MSFKYILNSSLFNVFIKTFIFRILIVILTFLSSVLLARTLGVNDFGIYSYIYSIVTIIALPCQAGVPTLVLRETAKAKTMSNWKIMKGIWHWSAIYVFSISFFTFIIVFFLKDIIFLKFEENIDILYLGFILSVFIALGNVRGAALRGLGHIIKSQLPEGIIRPLLLVLFLLFVFLFNLDINARDAMLLHLISGLSAFIFGIIILLYVKPRELKNKKAKFKNKPWLLAIFPLAAMTGMQSLNGQIDIIMLGYLSGVQDVGIYKVVISGASLIIFGLQAANMVIAPKIASEFAKNNIGKVQQIASIGSLISFVTTLPLLFIFYLWGEPLLDLIFGDGFGVGYLSLCIISIGQVVNAFFGSSISILTMSKNEKYVLKGVTIAAICNIVLNFILIPQFGMSGAAISASLSLIIWNIYLWIIIKKNLNLDCTFLWLLLRK